MNRLYFLLLLNININYLFSQNIIYVNESNNSNVQNGNSWESSFNNLQLAFNKSSFGDQIWVAKGTYYPAINNRDSAFVLKKGIKIFGGFKGNESNLSSRDILKNITVLSGDIGIKGDSLDNSYSVLISKNVDSTCVLDGFTITLGIANHSVKYPLNAQNSGGGIFITSDSNICPKLQNLIFNNNLAHYGGGLFSNSSINLDKCLFSNNYSLIQGGGILLVSNNYNLYNITNCDITNNFAFQFGGGIGIIGMKKKLNIYNCNFEKNDSYNGEGMSIYFDNFDNDSIKLKKCQFLNHSRGLNSSGSNGSIIEYFGINGNKSDNLYLVQDSCKFNNNRLKSGASALVSIYLFETQNYNIKFSNSTFENSKTENGCFELRFQSSFGNTTFNNCRFIKNETFNSKNKGGISIFGDYLITNQINTINLRNCVFAKNDGALSMINKTGTAIANLTNCTFFNNGEYPLWKTDEFENKNLSVNKINILNSLFWETFFSIDVRRNEHIFRLNSVTSPFIPLLNYYINNTYISNDDSCHYNNSLNKECNNIIYNIYPQFKDTTKNDFSLLPCSPLINKGDRKYIDSLDISYDLAGNPRIYQDSVDIGAYESQNICTVDINELDNNAALELIPNLVTSGATIQIRLKETTAIENYLLSIYDIGGKLISTMTLNNNLTFEAPKQKGFYIVHLLNENRLVGVGKLVVLE